MRRMWMLLLVVALMAVVMAVPAMAVEQVDGEWPTYTSCECAKAGVNGTCVVGCPGDETAVAWQPYTKTSGALPTSGNYYLTADFTFDSIAGITSTSVVRLDLNGYTVSVNSAKNTRVYALRGDSVGLQITDSSAGNKTGVGTGTIINDSNYTQGGVIWTQTANNQVVKIYAGTFDGTSYTAATQNGWGYGSLIYLTGGQFYMYGGEIKGCTLSSEEVSNHIRSYTSGTAYYPLSGPVYLQDAIQAYMYGGVIRGGYVAGGTHTDGKSTRQGRGGALHLAGTASFTMEGGTIYGGTAVYNKNSAISGYAGSVYITSGTSMTMNGGTITGGTAYHNGGSVFNAGTFTMNGGTITGGESTGDQAGNLWCSGTMTLNGGSITYGTSENVGGNVSVNTASSVTIGGVTISGGNSTTTVGDQVAFNINQNGECAYTVDGASITASGTGVCIYVNTNTTKQTDFDSNGDGINDTKVCRVPKITLNVQDGTVLTGGAYGVYLSCGVIDGYNATEYYGEDAYPSITANIYGTCTLGGYPALTGGYKDNITVNINGYPVNNYEIVYDTMDNALAAVAADTTNSSYLTLNDNYTDALNVDDLTVDLNGYSLSNVTATGTVKLLDSSAAGYNVGTGTAAITGGTVVTDFLTGSLTNYGHNYRFITVQDAEGKYTSHRIYLAVKATILYPGVAPYIGYRTALRCDDTIAALINADGGEYGILLNSVYTDYGTNAGAYVTDSTDNSTRVKLANLLGDDATQHETRSTATVSANAYIKIGDSTYTSANSTAHSLKSLTEAIVALDQNTIGESAKTALGQMYDTYSSFMAAWTGVADVLDGYYTAE